MFIGDIREPTEELYLAMQRLIPQLGPHKIPPNPGQLEELLRSEGCRLLIARDPDEQGKIVGILCLTLYRVPTGGRSIVEDFVVDAGMRKKGVGEALIRRAMDVARAAGANGLSLTSNPQREEANRFYISMGFQLRKTNAYFYKLEEEK
jgi:GNAT superfamily N-acetyltransferase